jgi:hypothetical protein
VKELLQRSAPSATCILGEALLLDSGGALTARLALAPTDPVDVTEPMTFMNQPVVWRKRLATEEVAFARITAEALGLPYFVRSISAMRYLKTYWDFAQGHLTYRAGDPLDLSAEAVPP